MAKKNSLGAADWILAAFRALTLEGPQGIRVEAIARELKVSKGSFYWHFKDVAALKIAMLDHWADVGTFSVIKKVEIAPNAAREQLFSLVRIAISFDDEAYGGSMVEVAIRDWARYYQPAERVLKTIDLARIEYVRRLFEGAGLAQDQSALYARILYGQLIGMVHLSHQGLADMPTDIELLLEILLAKG